MNKTSACFVDLQAEVLLRRSKMGILGAREIVQNINEGTVLTECWLRRHRCSFVLE